MKKLTQKQLTRKLQEYTDKENARKLGCYIDICEQEEFDDMLVCYKLEEKQGLGTLVYDVNIMSIMEDLFYNDWTPEDILKYILTRYNINDLLASENGEGLLFLRA